MDRLALDVRRVGSSVELALDVPSDVAYVGEAVELVARQCMHGALSPRRVRFNLRTALAEALSNAMIYGNGHDAAKLVRVRVRASPDAVRIEVADQGDGFDAACVPDPTTPENLANDAGRGLFVLRHLVDHVTFNDKGNTVCLTLRAG